ncbi:MAG TPA: apolipoprotein N-acyltransferase [Streptosporangiaceae bacterium]
MRLLRALGRPVRYLRDRPVRWLMLLAGALPVFAFPAPSLEFLAWFGLVPGLILIIRSPAVREAWVRAWWLGAGYVTMAMYWMAPEIGPGLVLLGFALGALLIPFGIATWKLLRPPVSWPRALAALVVVPSCWLFGEWIRSWQALGGPWDVYGASQWQHPAILGLAAVGGVWLISFVLVAANVAIVLIVGSMAKVTQVAKVTQAMQVAPVAPVAGVIGAVTLVAAVGSGPLTFALTAPSPIARQITIAMVQPGVINNPDLRAHASETLTASLSEGGTLGGVKPDLIVWGESSIAEDLTLPSSHALLSQIEALSARDGAEVLVSQDAEIPGKGHEKWSVLVSPSGIKGIYIKTRLVPFGEYIPFRQQLGWLTSISKAASSNMYPGPGAHLLDATDRSGRPLPIGVLICFESAFPDMSRVDTGNGAQVIVYQSATSTFQGTWGPDQHGSLSAVRAAEAGRPAVQAALTGDTVAFDARGRQLAWMGQSQHGVVTVRLGLPAASAQTLYDQWGDYVAWTALAVVVLAALVMLANSRGLFNRRAGATDGHAAQYVEGQSVPR